MKTMKSLSSEKTTEVTLTNEDQYKFYVVDKGTNLYYSDVGNKKIEDAFKNKQDTVHLNNEDVNMQKKSHVYYREQGKVKHKQSGEEFQVNIHGNKMFIVLKNGEEVRFPQGEEKNLMSVQKSELDIALGFYIIDVKQMLQINRFSGYQRKLQLETVNEPRYRFYVVDNGTNLYYSDVGNKKIEDAFKNKQDTVCLNNEDVNMQKKSHVYYREQGKVKHKQSGEEFQVNSYGNKMFIVLKNGEEVRLPEGEEKNLLSLQKSELDIALGFYMIDVKQMLQINQFSGYQRKLQFETVNESRQRFYVVDKGTNLYYSDVGNKKIEDAFKNKQDTVHLNNEDVNMQKKSHVYYREQGKVKHKQSGEEFQVNIHGNKMFIVLKNGEEVRFPQGEEKNLMSVQKSELDIALGFYIIDVKQMLQINRFSGYQRKL